MTDLTSDNTAAIERDLAATRSRMDKRLDQLENKLTPGQIMDELMGFVRGNDASVFTADLMASVKGNPLPAALTGIGLAWLMASNNRPAAAPAYTASADAGHARASGASTVAHGRAASPGLPWTTATDFDSHMSRVDAGTTRNASEDEPTYTHRLNEARGKALGLARRDDESHDSFGSRISHTIESTRHTLMDAAKGVADRVTGAAGQVGQAAQSALDSVTGGASNATQAASHLVNSVTGNPVLLGAFGLAVGAILGTLVPQSEQERQALKGVADTVRDTAAGLAQDAADKGSELAQAGLDAAQDAAKSAGLGGDMALKDVVSSAQSGELVDSVKKVATDALKAVDTAVSGGGATGSSGGGSSGGASGGGSTTASSPGGSSGGTSSSGGAPKGSLSVGPSQT